MDLDGIFMYWGAKYSYKLKHVTWEWSVCVWRPWRRVLQCGVGWGSKSSAQWAWRYGANSSLPMSQLSSTCSTSTDAVSPSSLSQYSPSHHWDSINFLALQPLEGSSAGVSLPGICLQSSILEVLRISVTLFRTKVPQCSGRWLVWVKSVVTCMGTLLWTYHHFSHHNPS